MVGCSKHRELKALSRAGRKKWSYRVVFRNLPDEQPQEFSARQLADTYGSSGGFLEGFCLPHTSLTEWPWTWPLTGTEDTSYICLSSETLAWEVTDITRLTSSCGDVNLLTLVLICVLQWSRWPMRLPASFTQMPFRS